LVLKFDFYFSDLGIAYYCVDVIIFFFWMSYAQICSNVRSYVRSYAQICSNMFVHMFVHMLKYAQICSNVRSNDVDGNEPGINRAEQMKVE
jgi:hypothetical protein